MKKFVGWVLVVSMFLFLFTAYALAGTSLQSGFYTLDGVLWLVFGTWAAVLLLKK
jgi:hypothetical protein